MPFPPHLRHLVETVSPPPSSFLFRISYLNRFLCPEPSLTWGKRGLSSLTFFTQSATSLFIALGQFLYSLLRSGEAYPRPTMKMI